MAYGEWKLVTVCDTALNTEREQQLRSLYDRDCESPPMDFDSDEETLLRLPRDVTPPLPPSGQSAYQSVSAD